MVIADRLVTWSAVIINSSFRRIFAFLSACGFFASAAGFTSSFFGRQPERTLPWLALLFIGVVVVLLPVFLLEYPTSREPTFFYNGFAKGLPAWVAPCVWILQLVALAQFTWLLYHFGFGVPAIRDGEYVIESRGQILQVISTAEYIALGKAWLRMILTIVASFYFVPMMYWWFRRESQPAQQVNSSSRNENPTR